MEKGQQIRTVPEGDGCGQRAGGKKERKKKRKRKEKEKKKGESVPGEKCLVQVKAAKKNGRATLRGGGMEVARI